MNREVFERGEFKYITEIGYKYGCDFLFCCVEHPKSNFYDELTLIVVKDMDEFRPWSFGNHLEVESVLDPCLKERVLAKLQESVYQAMINKLDIKDPLRGLL